MSDRTFVLICFVISTALLLFVLFTEKSTDHQQQYAKERAAKERAEFEQNFIKSIRRYGPDEHGVCWGVYGGESRFLIVLPCDK